MSVSTISNKSLILADHLLTATYPLVNDPKLLLGVLEHIRSYYVQVTPLILQKQGMQPLASIQGQLEQLKIQQLLPALQVQNIVRVVELHNRHQQSPVTFRKQERFVFCDTVYGLDILTEDKIKKELQLAKKLHTHIQVHL